MEWDGCTAIVTGAASGLGGATAERLGELGSSVLLLDTNPVGEEVARGIGGNARFVACDVREPDEVEGAIGAAEEFEKPVRIVVNCAGVVTYGLTAEPGGGPHDLEDFRRIIDVNTVGTFDVMRQGATAMLEAPPLGDGTRGVIVNTASVAGFDGARGMVAYVSSKAAVAAMSFTVARDLAPWGVRVVGIAPGSFDTPPVKGVSQEQRDALVENVPFPHRMGEPSEFADFVVRVIETPYLNGETVRLDGAMRMRLG